MKNHVIIVGAGPGGLAAALLLARAGLKVTVFERRGDVGGRTASLHLQDFRFDLGPTFFLYPQMLQRIFQFVGRDIGRELELVRLDPQYRIIFGQGGELLASPVLDELKRQVARLCPADAEGIGRYMAENRRKLRLMRPVLERPFLGWRSLLSPTLLRALPTLRPWNCLDDELRRYFSDERIRLAFSFQSKYLGMSPFQCPSLFSILAFLEYEHGVFHPIGGCSAITEAMARVATELGVTMRLNEPVQRLLLEGGRAVGVKTQSGEHRADAVVLNADFARAMTRLVPNESRRRWTDERLARKRFSCSTFMLYLGIEGIERHLPHHNIYIARDYARNLDEIEKRHVLSEDPSFYVQNASVTDSSLAPPGCSTLYILAPVTHAHANVDWDVERRRYRDLLIGRLARIGIADVEQRIRVEHILTPANWEDDHQIHLGATFNLAHSLDQMLHLRPRNRFEDLAGVYLVGGGTHPGSGLPVIFSSALISSRLLLRDLEMPTDWMDAPPVSEAHGGLQPTSVGGEDHA